MFLTDEGFYGNIYHEVVILGESRIITRFNLTTASIYIKIFLKIWWVTNYILCTIKQIKLITIKLFRSLGCIVVSRLTSKAHHVAGTTLSQGGHFLWLTAGLWVHPTQINLCSWPLKLGNLKAVKDSFGIVQHNSICILYC